MPARKPKKMAHVSVTKANSMANFAQYGKGGPKPRSPALAERVAGRKQPKINLKMGDWLRRARRPRAGALCFGPASREGRFRRLNWAPGRAVRVRGCRRWRRIRFGHPLPTGRGRNFSGATFGGRDALDHRRKKQKAGEYRLSQPAERCRYGGSVHGQGAIS